MTALTIEALKVSLDAEILKKRRTLRLVESPRFREMFSGLDEVARKLVEELVLKDDIDSLDAWIVKARNAGYAEMSVRQLRCQGQRLGVPHYQVLGKAILLSEIIKYEKVVESRSPAQVG